MRKLLDKIIHTNKGLNWWKPELFKKYVLDELPEELKVIETPPDKDQNYNCFIYTLGLSDNHKIIEECGGFIYSDLFQKLIDEELLEITQKPQKGDYILYRNIKNNPDIINHVGVITDDNMVISKWSWGPLLEHQIFDVPESYGNDVSYIKSISKEKALDLYSKYKKFNTKSNITT